jgi:putative heme-binding domain-containing protein
MPKPLKAFLIAFAFLPLSATSLSAAPRFEFLDGDRVVFLGDSFIEREQYNGWIELAATTQFPDRNVTFRNLGWSADTPAGESRNGLSLMQAGREPEDEGWRQLLKQLSEYKPNVIVLGYGMAASLDGAGTPEAFRENLNRLLDEAPKAAGSETRFLILGAPPRFKQPFDTTDELESSRRSLEAINAVLSDIAAKRDLPFVPLSDLKHDPTYSQDGIHLTPDGNKAAARFIETSLGWDAKPWDKGEHAEILRQHILRKNDWFFNRSRPANMAYIFGFRSREQGRNAKEIPEFDTLVATEDAAIAKMRDLSKGNIVPMSPERTASAFAANTEQEHPEFTVAEGFEVELWAENPLLHKPTQINFDPSGRLWVASSESYPQVEVGQTPDDKIIILEDTDGDGTADKSTVFAGGMMMPTAVLPGDGGAYVAQSTDLLHFKDTDGDGKADVKTRVLSGFGTEDTHHNLHTLRRGPDGRIWMNQSIYTRSDVETPHGIVRLKSGGIFRFDPHSVKLEPIYFGFWNSWGHQFDKYGQSFLTDGAGTTGINWGMPGATYEAFAGAEKILKGVSPGRYPKFSGLEIIESAHFPDDWQGNMITCDFRAHRIVRFSIADQGAGYVTQELEDVLRTTSVNFRPIDVKLGPDGALYVADWSNPIINHGEVDFRDPRRDREHGRIWKITKKGSPLLKTRDFTKVPDKELLNALTSDNRYDREQATAVLYEKETEAVAALLDSAKTTEYEALAELRIAHGHGISNPGLLLKVLTAENPGIRAEGIRILGDSPEDTDLTGLSPLLHKAVADPSPRVRVEAILALSKMPGAMPLDIALGALSIPTDRFIEYALWLNIQSHGTEWLAALTEGKIELTGNEDKLGFVLSNLPPAKTGDTMARLFPSPLPADGSGPWLMLGLQNGDTGIITKIFDQAVSGGFDEKTTVAALSGIATAVSQRRIKPTSDLSKLTALLDSGSAAAIPLAGALGVDTLLPALVRIANSEDPGEQLRLPAVDTLGNFSSPKARDALASIAGEAQSPDLRNAAALALAKNHRATAIPLLASIAADLSDPKQSRSFWQKALSSKGISKDLAKAFADKPLPPETAATILQYIPDVKEHDALLKLLRKQAGSAMAKIYDARTIAKMAASAAVKGDPNRGELIYRRPALACTACHAIGGAGGKVGPDMTSIGASAPLDYLIESVVNPGAKIKEGYHSVMIETKDGKSIMGQLVRSSGGTSVIRDGAGTEITIADEMISKKTDGGSLMPGNLINSLSPQETDDLFAFLSNLGKPGEFSSNESKAPKVYAIIGRTAENMDAAAKGEEALPWVPVNATVNGHLLPANLGSAKTGPGQPMIATKLQLAAPATVKLTFTEGFKPIQLFINGKPADTGTADLPAGIHTIVFRAETPKQPIRLQSNTGTFLPEW